MKERLCYAVLAASAFGTLLALSLVSLNRAVLADLRADAAHTRAEQLEEVNRNREIDLQHLKLLRLSAIVGNSVSLSGKDDFEKAISIRNYIHFHVPAQAPAQCYDYMPIDARFAKALRNDETGHACAGLAILYIAALESQGIPARFVGIYSDDKEPYASHATVEFWYNGKWHASDPSTNRMFTSEGAYLSYAELYGLAQDGTEFDPTTNGYAALPERKIEIYPPVQSGSMKYMVIHAGEVSRGKEALGRPNEIRTAAFEEARNSGTNRITREAASGNVTRYPMQLFPASWDGTITYLNGERRDVRALCGICSYLGNGPLR